MGKRYLRLLYKHLKKELNFDKLLPLMAYRYSATDNDSPKTVYGEVYENI